MVAIIRCASSSRIRGTSAAAWSRRNGHASGRVSLRAICSASIRAVSRSSNRGSSRSFRARAASAGDSNHPSASMMRVRSLRARASSASRVMASKSAASPRAAATSSTVLEHVLVGAASGPGARSAPRRRRLGLQDPGRRRRAQPMGRRMRRSSRTSSESPGRAFHPRRAPGPTRATGRAPPAGVRPSAVRRSLRSQASRRRQPVAGHVRVGLAGHGDRRGRAPRRPAPRPARRARRGRRRWRSAPRRRGALGGRRRSRERSCGAVGSAVVAQASIVEQHPVRAAEGGGQRERARAAGEEGAGALDPLAPPDPDADRNSPGPLGGALPRRRGTAPGSARRPPPRPLRSGATRVRAGTPAGRRSCASGAETFRPSDASSEAKRSSEVAFRSEYLRR